MTEFFTIPEGKEPTREKVLAAMSKAYERRDHFHPSRLRNSPEMKQEWIDFYFDTYMDMARAMAGEPLDTIPYPHDLDDIGDLMTVEEWLGTVEMGGFVDYDGYGHPVRYRYIEWKDGMDPTKYPTSEFKMSDMGIIPSQRHLLPKDATHVMWYNR